MRAYHVAAFVALAFWQAGPVQVVRGPGGGPRFRVSFAFASGQWEDYYEYHDCSGNVTETGNSPVPMRSRGVRADAFLRDGRIRVTAVGGTSAADSADVPQGTFWGAMIAYEGRTLGLGIGYRSFPNPQAGLWMTPEQPFGIASYARLGPLDKIHLRAEVVPLSETPSLAGDGRLGLAFGQGPKREPSGYFGLVVGPTIGFETPPLAAFAEFALPLGKGPDLLLRGAFGPGIQHYESYGFGAGLRATF